MADLQQFFIKGDVIFYHESNGRGNRLVGVITEGGWRDECIIQWWHPTMNRWISPRGLPNGQILFCGTMPFWAEWDV